MEFNLFDSFVVIPPKENTCKHETLSQLQNHCGGKYCIPVMNP